MRDEEVFDTKRWLTAQTKREIWREFIFNIAMKRAKTGNKRAGEYLKKKYGIVGLWIKETVVKF